MKKNNFIRKILEVINPLTFFKGFRDIQNKIIKRIVIFIMSLFFVYSAMYFYVVLQSDKITGIKHSYSEIIKVDKNELKNFTLIGNYYINHEKHRIISYSKDNKFYVSDFNNKNRTITSTSNIEENNIKNPIILLQLILYLQDVKNIKNINSIEILSDSIKINDFIFKLEFNNTQLKKVNGEQLNKFYNVLLVQKGQKELIQKEKISEDKLEIDNIEIKNHNLIISAKNKDSKQFYIFTTTQDEKVNLKTITY